MRLIDADALMNTLQELFDKREKEQIFTVSRGSFVTWNDAICHVKTAPTIDAVPVVLCKDCKWGREVCGNIECSVDMYEPVEYHGYEWFCPLGERKDDE